MEAGLPSAPRGGARRPGAPRIPRFWQHWDWGGRVARLCSRLLECMPGRSIDLHFYSTQGQVQEHASPPTRSEQCSPPCYMTHSPALPSGHAFPGQASVIPPILHQFFFFYRFQSILLRCNFQ
jgi:hypothetical protein